MDSKIAVVVTSISAPNTALQALALGAKARDIHFVVVGDRKSPKEFELAGCDYYGLEAQQQLPFALAKICPVANYARKNLGYLIARRNGAEVIVETDDDNIPRDGFWGPRLRQHHVPVVDYRGWVNVYRYFSDAPIWPRGFLLERFHDPLPALGAVRLANCPIQQGLADENPDVDAIYRMTQPLPISFRDGRIALGRGAWCPFNSQNTTFFREAFPLLYIPACCTMRVSDIWRSFVAQRIAWVNGWDILFHEATVYQVRNEHDLLRDFADEVPGYLNNRKLCEALDLLNLPAGAEHVAANLVTCYDRLIELGFIGAGEHELVAAWVADLAALPEMNPPPTSPAASGRVGRLAVVGDDPFI